MFTWVYGQVSEFQSSLASCPHSCLYDKVPVNTSTAGPKIHSVLVLLQAKHKASEQSIDYK